MDHMIDEMLSCHYGINDIMSCNYLFHISFLSENIIGLFYYC